MLSRKQIEILAQRSGVGLAVQERDYIQYLFLYLLNRRNKGFIFKGGTCLRVVYNSPRYSEDLDFNSSLRREEMELLLLKVVKDLRSFGIEGRLKNGKFLKSGFTADLSFQGVRFNGRNVAKNKVRIDVSERREKVEKVKMMVEPQNIYPDIPPFIIVSSSLKDIFAEKVRALLIRGKARDLWDIWFLVKGGREIG